MCINLQWLNYTVLKYLDDWEQSVKNNDKIPKAAKPLCTLPNQTIEGLKMCGWYIATSYCNCMIVVLVCSLLTS